MSLLPERAVPTSVSLLHECDERLMASGEASSPLLIVAQSPGSEEVIQGTPLIGLSGQILWKNGAEVGLFREKSYILNACCQVPQGGPSMAAPTAKQLAQCRPTFERLLKGAAPKVIVCLGGPALRAVTGLDLPINNNRGYLIRPADVGLTKEKVQVSIGEYKTSKKGHYAKGDTRYKMVNRNVPRPLPASVEWVIATLHPAAVHYEKYMPLPAFRQDLARAVRILTSPPDPVVAHFELLASHLRGPRVAFDIETTMDAKSLLAMGMDDGETCWTSRWTAECAGISRQILENPETEKIAHNASFDLEVLDRYGIRVQGPIFCTMLGFQLVQPDLFKGLGRVAPLYFDLERWKHLDQIDPDRYNATDVYLTRRLRDKIETDLVATNQDRLFHGTLMPALPVLVKMKRVGLLVDSGRLENWQRALVRREKHLVHLWRRMTDGVDHQSNPELTKFFYDREKLPVQRVRGKGANNRSTDEFALTKLMAYGPRARLLARTLLALRGVSKLRGTYAKSSLGWDQRVHPSYLPATKEDDEKRKGSAASGRLATSSPNIQNQPKIARRIFIPEPGNVFIEADWSQAEPRVVSHLSQDRKLLKALADGDLYTSVASELHVPRPVAKMGFLATIYGVGITALRRQIQSSGVEVSLADVKAFQKRVQDEFPDAWEWRQQIARHGQANGWVANPFGRRRFFYWVSEQVPEMINFIPQATVADTLWASFVPLDAMAESLGGAVVSTVHDSVLLEVPRENLYRASRGLVDILGREFPQVAPGFRLPIDLKWSASSWGEMEGLPFGS